VNESPQVRRVHPGVPTLPPRPATDGTRGRILLAGLALFAEHGYHGTSIRDIAAGADVQSASLYAHFPSKEAILAELVLAGHEEHHARLVTALLDSGTDPRDRLAALVRAHIQAHTDHPMLAVVATNEMHALSPQAAAPAAAVRRRSEALLAEVLAMGHQHGVFDLVHPEATAAAIGSMGIRVASSYPAPEAGLNPSQPTDAYASLALRMAGARQP
jgi:AcrR family transcriptional regulator